MGKELAYNSITTPGHAVRCAFGRYHRPKAARFGGNNETADTQSFLRSLPLAKQPDDRLAIRSDVAKGYTWITFFTPGVH